MQLWFARGSGVPLREQLVKQIVLGILCGDLSPEQRLPSTRELARRFHIHPNTVSSAYRKLEEAHWVKSQRGSGVYVCSSAPPASGPGPLALDRIIANLFRSARELGLSPADVRSRLQQWLSLKTPDHFLVLEPDDELRRILSAEIGHATGFPVKGTRPDLCRTPERFAGSVVVTMPASADTVGRLLPPGTEHVVLRLRSVTASLAPWLPAKPDALVAVASRSAKFLESAHTVLLAVGFREDALLIRDARKPGWQKGLAQTAAVVCDFLTAAAVPKNCRPILFLLVSETSLSELKRVQQAVLCPSV